VIDAQATAKGTQTPDVGPPSWDRVVFASVWRRLAAYLIDTLPLTLIVTGIFWAFFGLDEAWRAYSAADRSPSARAEFLTLRNRVRDLTFLVWVVYCVVLEASPWQATAGKRLLGLRVVDEQGRRLTFGRSLGRNAFKIISYAALYAGFLWAAFTRRKQAWHDLVARTYVVEVAWLPVPTSSPAPDR
jgi:uncharacterized RDD family membrane protein YckC